MIYRQDDGILYYLSKPLLLLSLLLYFIYRTEKLSVKMKWWVSATLLFSLLGDSLLMRNTELFFLLGMGAFALTHISYIVFFLIAKEKNWHWKALFFSVLFGSAAFGRLSGINIPEAFTVPVYVYSALILFNLIVGVQFSYGKRLKFTLIPLGLGLFVVSDLLIAHYKFREASVYLNLAIMVTYAFAQYLITVGVLRFLDNGREITVHNQ